MAKFSLMRKNTLGCLSFTYREKKTIMQGRVEKKTSKLLGPLEPFHENQVREGGHRTVQFSSVQFSRVRLLATP